VTGKFPEADPLQLETSQYDVSHRTTSPVLASARKVAEACSAAAPDLDQAGTVSLAHLQPFIRSGLLSRAVASRECAGSTVEMLEILMIIGSGDLSLGRLYEGHLNAVLLVRRFGRPDLQRRVECAIGRGALLGVWNTDAARPLNLVGAAAGFHLEGGKAFASGASAGIRPSRWGYGGDDLAVFQPLWPKRCMRAIGKQVLKR